VLGIVCLLAMVFGANLVFALEQVVAILHTVPFADSFFLEQCVLLALYGIVSISLLVLFFLYRKRTLIEVVRTFLALLFASAAVATGGDFFPQHFLFAIPIYVACFLTVELPMAGSVFLAILLLCNTFYPFRYNTKDMDEGRQITMDQITTAKGAAQGLDALMIACRYSRYFIIGDSIGGLQGVTVHSPYQLNYGLQRAESQRTLYFDDQKPNPFFHTKLIRDFGEAPILVMDAKSASDFPYPDLQQAFMTNFSADAPPCAQPYLPIPGVSVFFRV
jgi:hypothetical protein